MNHRQLLKFKSKDVRAYTDKGEVFGKLQDVEARKVNIDAKEGSFVLKFFGIVEAKGAVFAVPVENIYPWNRNLQ
jgi:hypothetical protein